MLHTGCLFGVLFWGGGSMAKAQPVFCLKRADNGAAADFPLSRQQSARPLFAHEANKLQER